MPPVTPPVVAAVLVNWPVMNGTSCATLSSASWLSMVTAEGVERTLVLVSPRSARSVAAKFTPVPAMRPMPIVVPCRSALEALAGFWMAAARSTMLVPPTGLTKAPAGTLLPFEKAAQLTPSSAFLSTSTSAMIASTSTCGRRMSSLSMMSMTACMILGGAVITSALLVGSAHTMAFFSACASGEAWPPGAPAPAAAWVMPVICSLSFGAIFSAFA